MRIACHQPNFMPWKPFFDKIASVDIFVLMVNCQFEKNGFQNRFRLNENSPWHTMSVNHGRQPILGKRYVNHAADWSRIKFNLTEYPVLAEFDDCISDSLWPTNVEIIARIAGKLGIKTRLVFDFPTEKKGTERLIEICQKFNADTYVGGSSMSKYMEPRLFEMAGIKVEPQVFQADNHDKRHVLEVLK